MRVQPRLLLRGCSHGKVFNRKENSELLLFVHMTAGLWGPETANFWNWVLRCNLLKHNPYCHRVNWKYAVNTVMSQLTLHMCITSRRTTITMAECVFCVCAETRDVILRSVITKSHHQQLALHAYYSIFDGFAGPCAQGLSSNDLIWTQAFF